MRTIAPKAALMAAALLASAPAFGQAGPANDAPPPAAGPSADPKVNQLIVYGDDPCPASSEDEITVCARVPESERYRIPENLRDLGTQRSESWSNKATELSYVGKTGTDSCSTTGPGGFTGCLTQMIQTAAKEREGRDAVDWNRLIEQARQERLGTIDERTEEIERELSNQPK